MTVYLSSADDLYASVCINAKQKLKLLLNIILPLASKYSSCKPHLTKILHGHLKLIFLCKENKLFILYSEF